MSNWIERAAAWMASQPDSVIRVIAGSFLFGMFVGGMVVRVTG